jgi:hypothetical protein
VQDIGGTGAGRLSERAGPRRSRRIGFFHPLGPEPPASAQTQTYSFLFKKKLRGRHDVSHGPRRDKTEIWANFWAQRVCIVILNVRTPANSIFRRNPEKFLFQKHPEKLLFCVLRYCLQQQLCRPCAPSFCTEGRSIGAARMIYARLITLCTANRKGIITLA